MNDKKAFLKTFFPESVEDIQLTTLDLDTANLTLCDIMRNVNQTFPINSRDRFEIIDGRKVVAVICKSDLISPANGIILIFGHDTPISTESRNYILISIDETDIKEEETINNINNDIVMYLAKLLRGGVRNFDEFYNRYLYNDYERYRFDEDDDEY